MPHEGGAGRGNEGEKGDEGEALHGGVAEGDTLASPPCHLEPRTRTLCRREDNFASSNYCGSSLTLRLGRRGTVNLDVNAGNTSSLRASGITARMTRRYSRATQPLCRGTERGTEGATRHSRGNEQEQTEGTTWPGTARAGWERGGSGWWWLRRKQLPSRNLPANPRTQDPSGTIPGSQRTLRAMWGWDTGFRCSGDE